MAGESFSHSLRRVAVFDLTDNERVIPGDLVIRQRDIGLRSPGLLVLKCVSDQETVEGVPSAVKRFEVVGAL